MTPPRLLTRWRKRARALLRTSAVDRELDEELAFHLDMETDKNVRNGMTPDEARRQAKLAFGAVPKARGETRDARWLSWFPDLSLDFKLGARMLIKYPWLTLVGGLAMAFGIWVGATTFEMITMLMHPSLPLPGGDRIVQLRNWDVQESKAEPRALHDFILWKGTLRSVADLGAFRNVSHNLIVKTGDAGPVVAAEMSASAFRLAPVAPLLGRTLVEADERASAPPVVVIGYDVWKTRFAADSGAIGSRVQVGETYATVVGVMPEGYAFPVSHELWLPFRIDGMDQTPRAGSPITIFGRLPDGVTMAEAQAELALIGQRMSRELPTTHRHLQPQLTDYVKPFLPNMNTGDNILMYVIPAFGVLLLVLVCGNVALLMFARAATRESEMVVRSALGASRGRIVAQLFAEALVLGGVGAAIGLAAADFGLRRWGLQFLTENLGRQPFWYDPHVSLTTVLYVVGLTLLAAAIAGVLPALKVTKGMGARLRQAGAGGGGLKFGGVWTVVIVAQIAVTTAFPALVYFENQALIRVKTAEAGFPSEQYVSVWIEPQMPSLVELLGDDPKAVAIRKEIGDRFIPALAALRQRVASEPGVLGVTFIDNLPRDGHDHWEVLLDDAPGATLALNQPLSASTDLPVASIASVDRAYFEVVGAPILAGRGFGEADLVPDPRVVIVDQGFVDQVLKGRNAIGRRIRFVDQWRRLHGEVDSTQHWREIVGVVKELGMGAPHERDRPAGVYVPVTPGHQGPTHMMVHTRGDPLAMVPQLRAMAASVDPTLRLTNFQRVDQVTSGMLWIVLLWLRITVFLTAVALLLSLAGIYAVMSFTVSRRTREIGIRIALGANPRRVIAAIFRRPLTQVVVGVACGAVLVTGFFYLTTTCRDAICDPDAVSLSRLPWLLLYSLIVLGVCLLACVVPTRRALAVEPVEALRTE